MTHRHAVFATPDRSAPLTRLAARWLGRDAFTGEAREQLDVERIRELTAFPRRYGFHATIIAPFRPAPGIDAETVDASLDAFCRVEPPIAVPLAVARISRFFALVPRGHVEALNAMEARAVRHFHPLRAEPSEDEIARRHPETLDVRGRELLARWHYPHVLDRFRYHMTLTGPVPDDDAERIGAAIEAHFPADALDGFEVDGLARYDEPEPEGVFRVATRVPFAGMA